MSEYRFISKQDSYNICELIKEAMINEFKIAEDEAIGRMNRLWGKYSSPIDEDEDFLNLETPQDWAYIIYYGEDSQWWNKSKDLTPRPYP
ncbi:hypothetical protein [Paenibacillus nasutitermitis]|uniref:Uncharacterized protein n=1 Tax=Paenibacillus nasutitermitis TaxID=1652958 RepID=A0A916Z993_9BACL|nr:hypothetical protein [Paenibacillus nasutitermitis]GGD82493.1 hypothetical protein GCM10010911_45790 [Paenibacillus nasutitermitis]